MNLESTSKHATRRAASVTILLILFAAIKAVFGGVHPLLFALYAMLLLHTFFSIRCFSSLIDSHDRRQQSIDVVLIVLYALLATALQSIPFFLILWIIFFCAASGKYIMLVGRLNHPHLLKRKITADMSGILLGILSLLFFPNFPYTLEIMTSLYMIASVHYLCLNKLYVADQEAARRSDSQP